MALLRNVSLSKGSSVGNYTNFLHSSQNYKIYTELQQHTWALKNLINDHEFHFLHHPSYYTGKGTPVL